MKEILHYVQDDNVHSELTERRNLKKYTRIFTRSNKHYGTLYNSRAPHNSKG